jgi:hypothetical protein
MIFKFNQRRREDACVVCAEWPAEHRPYLRWYIISLPKAAPICDGCLLAFWDNCFGLRGPDKPGFFFPDIEAAPPPRHR